MSAVHCIPTHLLQTWETNEVPEQWQRGPNSFKRLHPFWHYTLLNHEQRKTFIQSYFPELASTFNRFPHLIQQADVIRYAYLYIHGGVYSDLKNVFVKSLDQLFQKDPQRILYISQSPNGGGISNYFLASTPRHPVWLACLQLVLERNTKPLPIYLLGKYATVYYTTGPWVLQAAIEQLHLKKEEIVLPPGFQPCGVCDENRMTCENTEETYLMALAGRSWNGWDSHIINWLFCHRDLIQNIIVVCLVLWWVARIESLRRSPTIRN